MKNIKQTGFTIVELLVVIVIIGILAAVTVVAYTGINQQAIIAALKSDLVNASKQFELYKVDHDYYPTGFSNNCPTTPSADASRCLKPSNGNAYNPVRPTTTPNSTFCIESIYTATSTTYHVENNSEPAADGCPSLIPTGVTWLATLN